MLSATARLWVMAAAREAVDEEDLKHQDVGDLLHIDSWNGEAPEVVGAGVVNGEVAGVALTLRAVEDLDIDMELTKLGRAEVREFGASRRRRDGLRLGAVGAVGYEATDRV